MRARVGCPYCGEICVVFVDESAGARQEYVEDCQVCCQPWNVIVQWDGGEVTVDANRLED